MAFIDNRFICLRVPVAIGRIKPSNLCNPVGPPTTKQKFHTVRQKKRNRFSFVCIFIMPNRNW